MYHAGKAFFPYRTCGRSLSNSAVLFFCVCFLNKYKSDDKNCLEKICFSDKFSMHYSINNSRPNYSLVWRFRVCQVPGGGGESIYGWFSSTKEFTWSKMQCLISHFRHPLPLRRCPLVSLIKDNCPQTGIHTRETTQMWHALCIFRTRPRALFPAKQPWGLSASHSKMQVLIT